MVTTVDGGYTAEAFITVMKVPNEAPIAIVSSDVLEGETPLFVNFVGSASTDDLGIVKYEWNFGDGNKSNQPDILHVYRSVGIFTVSLTVTDVEGLTDTEELTIVVLENTTLTIGDMKSILFPNPAKEFIQISLIDVPENTIVREIHVNDLSGKFVKGVTAENALNGAGNYELYIGDLQNSMYYVYVFISGSNKPLVLTLLVDN